MAGKFFSFSLSADRADSVSRVPTARPGGLGLLAGTASALILAILGAAALAAVLATVLHARIFHERMDQGDLAGTVCGRKEKYGLVQLDRVAGHARAPAAVSLLC